MVPQRHNEENGRYTATAESRIPRQIAFLPEWEQENDDPSRMHAEDSKNSHKLDTFWRHECWWKRRRDRRVRACWRHEHLSIKVEVATATHHPAARRTTRTKRQG